MKKINPLRRFSTILLVTLLFICSLNAQENKQPKENKFEKEIIDLEQLDKTEKYADNSILFIGSSSIRMWSTLKEDIAPYPFIQRGFGGSRTPDVVYYQKRLVYPHNFRAVVFFVGNDQTGAPNDLKQEETLHNFREMVKIIRAKYKKQPIFIIEITPCSSRWKSWAQIQQTNALLKNFCKKGKNLYFIETAQNYLNEKGEPRDELFREDHLHQNREGYKIWGKLIKDELDRRLKEKG
ncbi:MAG: GDSL-type esterase/lipase family protein [Prolixibacteraceae bacterium]